MEIVIDEPEENNSDKAGKVIDTHSNGRVNISVENHVENVTDEIYVLEYGTIMANLWFKLWQIYDSIYTFRQTYALFF